MAVAWDADGGLVVAVVDDADEMPLQFSLPSPLLPPPCRCERLTSDLLVLVVVDS